VLSPLDEDALDVAPTLLGCLFSTGGVTLRITEVEAYRGSIDPGSHAFRGRTGRNATMFGPPGHLYAYFSYGMHVCANIVCSPEGEASAVLLRAGQIVDGIELARERRGAAVPDRDLARGPARLTVALGIELADDGAAIRLPGRTATQEASTRFSLQEREEPSVFESGPRTGVGGAGGGGEYPWRFWIPGDPTVSPYRASVPRVRRSRPDIPTRSAG